MNHYVVNDQVSVVEAAELDIRPAALQMLTHDLRADGRREASNCLLECLGRGYDAIGHARPDWLAQLRAEHGARPSR